MRRKTERHVKGRRLVFNAKAMPADADVCDCPFPFKLVFLVHSTMAATRRREELAAFIGTASTPFSRCFVHFLIFPDYPETFCPSDKILGLIEDATDKVKDCTDPEKAFAIMAETSKAIDKACKDAGTSLSGWIQSLSDSELKRYEDATAKFQQAVKQ